MPSSHPHAAIRALTTNAGIVLAGRDGDLGFAAASDEKVVAIEMF